MACTLQERALLLAKLQDPAQVATHIRNSQKVTRLDKLMQVWKSSLMSTSSLGNAVASDMSMIASDLYSTALAAAGQSLGRAPDRVRFAEVPAKISAMLHSTARAWEEARAMYGNGRAAGAGLQELHGPMRALDRYGPMAALRAESEFFYRWAYDGEVASLATRQGLEKGLRGDALEKYRARAQEKPESFQYHGKSFDQLADTAAKHRTFQDRSAQAEAITRFGAARDRFGRPIENEAPLMGAARAGGRLLLPFPRIAVNLTKATLEHSPFASLVLPEVRAALKAGGTEAALARGRIVAGTSSMAMVAYLVSKGLIQGSAPLDPDERRAWLAAGNQEYSIKIGDRRLAFRNMEPLGSVLGLAADFAQMVPKLADGTIDKLGTRIAMAFVKNLPAARDYAKLADLAHAATDWKNSSGKRALDRLAATVVPNQLNKLNQLQDPYLHDTQSLMDEVKARIPGMSQGLAKRIDAWGQPIKNEAPGLSLFFSTKVSSVTDDPVRQEAVRLRMKLSAPDRSLQLGKKKMALNPHQYEQLSRHTGAAAHEAVSQLMRSDAWRSYSDAHKAEAFRRAFNVGRKVGRARFLAENGVPDGAED